MPAYRQASPESLRSAPTVFLERVYQRLLVGSSRHIRHCKSKLVRGSKAYVNQRLQVSVGDAEGQSSALELGDTLQFRRLKGSSWVVVNGRLYHKSLSAPGWNRLLGNIFTSERRSTHAETGRVCVAFGYAPQHMAYHLTQIHFRSVDSSIGEPQKFHLRLRHGPHADTGRVCSC